MIRIRQLTLLTGAVGGLWLLGPATPTTEAAPLVPRLLAVTPEGGNFRWSYTASITADEQIVAGDFWTIYDILGLIGTGTAPAGWTVASANVGATPDFAFPPGGDSPAVPNVTFTYTGAAILGPSANVGTFTFLSSIGGIDLGGSFAAETTQQGGPTAGADVFTSGSVPVPVPEPATVLLVLAGPLFLFGAVKGGLRLRPAPAA